MAVDSGDKVEVGLNGGTFEFIDFKTTNVSYR
jgi:hypothetical protein